MQTQRLDRGVQVHHAAGDREFRRGGCVGDVTGGHRTVQLAGFRRLADQHEGRAVQVRAFLASLGGALGVQLLDCFALALEAFHVGVGGAQRFGLRQQEVAGVTRLHRHHVADGAELFDTFKQNNLHGLKLP